MAEIRPTMPATHEALAAVKRALHNEQPHLKSSHLTEALAAALGFNTNAALQAHLKSGPTVPLAFDAERFAASCLTRGVQVVPDFVIAAVRAGVATPTPPEAAINPFAAHETFQSTPLERCHAYGVRIERRANGDVFALHNVGGCVGPCADEHAAAQLACSTWDI